MTSVFHFSRWYVFRVFLFWFSITSPTLFFPFSYFHVCWNEMHCFQCLMLSEVLRILSLDELTSFFHLSLSISHVCKAENGMSRVHICYLLCLSTLLRSWFLSESLCPFTLIFHCLWTLPHSSFIKSLLCSAPLINSHFLVPSPPPPLYIFVLNSLPSPHLSLSRDTSICVICIRHQTPVNI